MSYIYLKDAEKRSRKDMNIKKKEVIRDDKIKIWRSGPHISK